MGALYCSLVETAKANGLPSYDYIWYAMEKAPYCKSDSDWDALLPWNIDPSDLDSIKRTRGEAKPDPGRKGDYILRGSKLQNDALKVQPEHSPRRLPMVG